MLHIAAMPREGADRIESDEAALVREAQENRAAFGLLYQRYVDRIYAYLRARAGTAEDAADLTQQVFLQALTALPRYRVRRSPFAAWLFRIARNSAINHHQRHASTITWDLVPEALQPVIQEDLAGRIMRQERFARLRIVFGALDPATRELLVLRFTAQLTIHEIAATLGTSDGATKMRLRRALDTLKEKYHDHTL